MSESPTDEPTTDEAQLRDESDPGETRTQGQGEPEGQKWLSGIVSLIGLWVLISPFVYEAAASTLWNNVIVGGAVFLLAGYNYYRIVTGHPTSTGVMSLVVLLGLWTIVAPFAFAGEFAVGAVAGADVAAEGLVWSNVVVGALGALIAAYVAYAAGREAPAGAPVGAR